MTIEDLAHYLQVPKQTIYAWRSSGRGPRALVVGRHLRWTREDVAAWVDSRREPDRKSA